MAKWCGRKVIFRLFCVSNDRLEKMIFRILLPRSSDNILWCNGLQSTVVPGVSYCSSHDFLFGYVYKLPYVGFVAVVNVFSFFSVLIANGSGKHLICWRNVTHLNILTLACLFPFVTGAVCREAEWPSGWKPWFGKLLHSCMFANGIA